jgi:hypothetical protein
MATDRLESAWRSQPRSNWDRSEKLLSGDRRQARAAYWSRLLPAVVDRVVSSDQVLELTVIASAMLCEVY